MRRSSSRKGWSGSRTGACATRVATLRGCRWSARSTRRTAMCTSTSMRPPSFGRSAAGCQHRLRRGLSRPLFATSAPRHICAVHLCPIGTGTGLTPATSAPGLGSFRPHLHRDWAHPGHICTGTGLANATAIGFVRTRNAAPCTLVSLRPVDQPRRHKRTHARTLTHARTQRERARTEP